MGYFKSVSKKRRRRRKILKFMILIILIFLCFIFIKKNIRVKQKTLNHMTKSMLQANSVNKQIKPVVDKIVFKEKEKPIVYIYNTHQTENYKYEKISSYNIEYSVMFASYILEEYLEHNGINTLVETNLISNILKENSFSYADSYKASRILLEKSFKENNSLKYFIDIHRDSIDYNSTTCDIEGKKYAKILFVIGKDNPNYEKNNELATKLDERLKRINPCISRGIMQKSGKGVNGVYNQDFNHNTILIELGGKDNTIDEVNSTIKILSSVLTEYIKEEK